MCGTWEPVALVQREKFKQKSRKNESTDTRHRGGTARSSDDNLRKQEVAKGLSCLVLKKSQLKLNTGGTWKVKQNRIVFLNML